ncbi:type VI secretion system tip protein TssI/VgrG [Niveibacterium sp. 24ML]|uniref:type VI secretion system Vgr family protein n=1 Tax=Niveibacterium sp. 24ML TaxID=2985512 RepID=UPI00226EF49A|nr:type VI secretion system tip protein VgrG [Niveibacterium sp. 24ML]MCX9156610.1 type VI secretion system tip protein TssI/VgrG [Niveibacterium sp. 24ML]
MAFLESFVEIVSPLEHDLLFRSMQGHEEIGRLFEYQVTVLSPKNQLELDDLIGKTVTVKLRTDEGTTREFSGFVTAMAQTGIEGRFHRYQLTVRPWAWLMSRTADCKIFQQKSVPEIIKAVFADHAVADVEFSLSETYRTREYCVQYRESDLGFICRLMEQEGIYFYFKHTGGRHKMVVTDSYAGHQPSPRFETVEFVPHSERGIESQSGLRAWRLSREIQPSRYVVADFDFTKPRANLLALKDGTLPGNHAQSNHEVFDYPGEYDERSEGERLARVRIEELRHQHEVCSGSGNVRGLGSGALFKLAEHPRADQNREYLILSASYAIEHAGHESVDADGDRFEVSITAIPSRQPFHPARVTPKPFVQGPQTAIVVGPSGDEIYTDKYGRVKVKFHWDRYTKGDQNSSCWIRVSHPWAGNKWGMIAIPRIGQEVIVEFLEGDPDRPIITGRVYNDVQMPPYALPENMTQTGIKTRSSKASPDDKKECFNEIRFEDKKGSEQIFIHAEKNQDIEVEHDETHRVGNDRRKTIDNDETTHVKHDRTETVDNNETITIGVNRTESVGKVEAITIGTNRTLDVGENASTSIGKNRSITVGVDESHDVGANRQRTVGKNETIDIGTDLSQTVGKNVTVSIGENQTLTVGKDSKSQVGKKYYLEAADEITLKTGAASITMKKDGTITIKGKDITIQGSGKIGVKASGDVVVKGSKIANN